MKTQKPVAQVTARRRAAYVLSGLIFLALALPARARTEYVANGDFATLTNGTGHLANYADATDWATTGYGSSIGLPPDSPAGQNFIAVEAGFPLMSSVPESETVSLLLVGFGLIGGGWLFRSRSRRRGVAVARLRGPGTSGLSESRQPKRAFSD